MRIPFDQCTDEEKRSMLSIARSLAVVYGVPSERLRPIAYIRDGWASNIVWPVEEFIARRKIKKRSTLERLRRLNAAGVVEGEYPRGWQSSQRFTSRRRG